MVTAPEITVLLLAVAAYVAGGIGSIVALAGKPVPRHFRSISMGIGIALSAGLLVWHSAETATWQPLEDNLSAMLTLAVLLSLFVAYIQHRRPIPSLEWLIMPIVIALLLMAGHFGKTQPHPYLTTTYSLVHRLSSYLGTLAFVVAGMASVLYLMSDRALRSRTRAGVGARHLAPHPGLFGSLERLDHLTYSAVTLGFALFTVGIVTGIVWVVHEHGKTRLGTHWFLAPKVLLAFAAWLIFAIIVHTPIAPRLRGRKDALLSIIGVIMTIATLFAVLLMPKGGV
jgi:ABC-type transport system involved in cytochrome c biogenesis permease subunit